MAGQRTLAARAAMAAAIAGPAFVGVMMADTAAVAAGTSFGYGAYHPNLGGYGLAGSISGRCTAGNRVQFAGTAEDSDGAQSAVTGSTFCGPTGTFTLSVQYTTDDAIPYGAGDIDRLQGSVTELDPSGHKAGTYSLGQNVTAQ